ncbi:MAG TPA: substrate-binding domain-containing protein [bacterium]|nr:substrate-binding domain-containing protein [bacterium]
MPIRFARRLVFCLAAAAVASMTLVPAMRAAGQGAKPAVRVGMIYSATGPLASYGAQFREGFQAGLAYATNRTGAIAGHKIDVAWDDDAGDPAKAVSAAKDLIGQGLHVLAGPTSSAVGLQVAPLAAQNRVLLISGPAAADAITGVNRYTFRSGRQTYQDILAARSFIGSESGKKVIVFAQDYAFGQANVAAVRNVLGRSGAEVSQILVPLNATDFTPFALQAKQAKPDLLFVAWAGATAPAMWQALDQQGVFGGISVVTGLDQRSSYATFGPVASRIGFLSHYVYQAPHNRANDYLIQALKAQGKVPDLFDPDGFVAAQMIVHAVQIADGDDVDKMIRALENWTFLAPKGQQIVRAGDHAMLQPMFQVKLVASGGSYEPQIVKAIAPVDVAPPVTPFKP